MSQSEPSLEGRLCLSESIASIYHRGEGGPPCPCLSFSEASLCLAPPVFFSNRSLFMAGKPRSRLTGSWQQGSRSRCSHSIAGNTRRNPAHQNACGSAWPPKLLLARKVFSATARRPGPPWPVELLL
ncbi:hypothetical protein HJG60_008326 [Phyllostomus discolor]|uniref:Uncharacterized protein n=1 Tax=Phyllostomus discolor TaxID=89673 RepID=A0A833Z1L2_9CHIR|nr:hypothetical protein HJG60_008326 [Phyllostomus discolor]